MRQDYEQLFTHLTPPEPPKDLLDKIIQRVYKEQCTQAFRLRFAFFGLMLVISATAVFFAFKSVQLSLVGSGFVEFISLIFADAKTVMMYWDSFAIAVVESLPIMSIVIFLTAIFIFLESLKYVARDIKVVFSSLKIS